MRAEAERLAERARALRATGHPAAIEAAGALEAAAERLRETAGRLGGDAAVD